MHQMGYTLCKADPDLWYKAEIRPQDNEWYYAYILCYVDDILCMHHDAMSVLDRIDKCLLLKPTSVGDPYVDDILCMHHDAMSVLDWINKCLQLKPTSVGDPDIYLDMDSRVLEQYFVPTLLHSCAKWVTLHVKLTLTFGTRLRPGHKTMNCIMPTFYAM